MQKWFLIGLSFIISCGLLAPLYGAQRTVICEEAYSEG